MNFALIYVLGESTKVAEIQNLSDYFRQLEIFTENHVVRFRLSIRRISNMFELLSADYFRTHIAFICHAPPSNEAKVSV